MLYSLYSEFRKVHKHFASHLKASTNILASCDAKADAGAPSPLAGLLRGAPMSFGKTCGPHWVLVYLHGTFAVSSAEGANEVV